MPVKHEIKSQLARLLATEDLIVEHKQVKTAQFNVHTRELILPLWEKASDVVYDMLVGHEVGHALFTPDVDWSEDVNVPPQFMNVVEDVRIEKLIKRKYMGLAKTFYRGYSELADNDFFEIEDEDISTFNLADRINLYAKIGSFVNVPFSDAEKEIVSLVKACETFEDVKNAAQVLYDFCKQENNQEKSEQQPEQETQGELELPSLQDGQESDSSESESDGGEEDKDAPAPKSNIPSDKETGTQDTQEDIKEPEVRTEKSLSQKLEDLIDTTAHENIYLEKPDVLIDRIIASNKDVHKEIDYSFSSQQIMWEDRKKEYPSTEPLFDLVDSEYEKFKKDAQKEVNYLVKEFECRKSASAYARATTSRTGVLDTAKLQTYKFNEDLFKKVSILPDGKNHGLIFVLDWSGSMNQVMLDTIKQLYNLMWFCKKVQIPFEVYAFTNEWNRSCTNYETGEITSREKLNLYNVKEYAFKIDDDFSLMNMFTSNVKSNEFDKQLLNIWRIASLFGCYQRGYGGTYYRYQVPYGLNLSGTPLNEALLCLHKIIPNFQKQNNVEKVQCIVLTDGEANRIPYHVVVQRNWDIEPHMGCRNVNPELCSLRDRKLGRTYKFGWDYYEFTSALLENLKDNFPSTNFIGIRVLAPRDAKHFIRRYHPFSFSKEHEKALTDWSKNKSFVIKTSGYHSYFGLSSANLAEDVEFDVDDDATKAQIKRAFVKSLKTKKLNKKILSEFVELVC